MICIPFQLASAADDATMEDVEPRREQSERNGTKTLKKEDPSKLPATDLPKAPSLDVTNSFASSFRPGKLSPLQILTRLFTKESPNVLELVLQGCDGDLIKAIEHFLSASDSTGAKSSIAVSDHAAGFESSSKRERMKESAEVPYDKHDNRRKTAETTIPSTAFEKLRRGFEDSLRNFEKGLSSSNVDKVSLQPHCAKSPTETHPYKRYMTTNSPHVAYSNEVTRFLPQRPFHADGSHQFRYPLPFPYRSLLSSQTALYRNETALLTNQSTYYPTSTFF